MTKPSQPIRVRITKNNFWYKPGKEYDVVESNHPMYWRLINGSNCIPKSDCTVLSPAGESVPPGIVAFKSPDGRVYGNTYAGCLYEDWVRVNLSSGHKKPSEIHTIRDSNGIMWAVEDHAKMGYDTFRIDSFKWNPESNTWSIGYTDLDPEDTIQPGETWIGNLTKLPSPQPTTDPLTDEVIEVWIHCAGGDWFAYLDTYNRYQFSPEAEEHVKRNLDTFEGKAAMGVIKNNLFSFYETKLPSPQPTTDLPDEREESFVPIQKYEYKGNFYFKVDNAKMKIGQKWISCMIYTNEDKSEIYVREFDDFLEKFKLIK